MYKINHTYSMFNTIRIIQNIFNNIQIIYISNYIAPISLLLIELCILNTNFKLKIRLNYLQILLNWRQITSIWLLMTLCLTWLVAGDLAIWIFRWNVKYEYYVIVVFYIFIIRYFYRAIAKIDGFFGYEMAQNTIQRSVVTINNVPDVKKCCRVTHFLYTPSI